MSPLTPGMPTPAAPCPLGCLLTPPHPRPPRPTLQQAESPSLCLEAPQPLAQPPEGILRFSSGHLRSLVGPLPSLLTGSCLLPWSALSQRGPGESHVGPTLLCSKPAPGLTRVNPSMFTPEGPGPPHPSWTAPSTCPAPSHGEHAPASAFKPAVPAAGSLSPSIPTSAPPPPYSTSKCSFLGEASPERGRREGPIHIC